MNCYKLNDVHLQVRDYRKDWHLEVNQPVAGNYYPVCFVEPCVLEDATFIIHMKAQSIKLLINGI